MPHIDREGVLTATQVLSATVPKAALLPWAVKCCAEDLAQQLAARGVKVTQEEIRRAKQAHTRASEKARDVGHAVHAMIDIAVAAGLGEAPATTPPEEWTRLDAEGRERAQRLFGLWGQWIETAGLTPVLHEVDLWEEGALLAGSCDLVARCADGKLAVVDWKTSKSIYSDSWYQLGIYAHLLRKRDVVVERLIVVRIGDDGVETRQSDRVQDAIACALALFESAKWLTREKNPWNVDTRK